MTVNLLRYQDFVEQVTSKPSNDIDALVTRLYELNQSEPKFNVSLLMTAAAGLSSEAGEFGEIVKKMIFQGKPWNEDIHFHLMRELCDVAWYWVNGCRALGVDPNDVIAENVKKLEARYPGGSFDVHFSENRKSGDL